jgi:hypothetical protein
VIQAHGGEERGGGAPARARVQVGACGIGGAGGQDEPERVAADERAEARAVRRARRHGPHEDVPAQRLRAEPGDVRERGRREQRRIRAGDHVRHAACVDVAQPDRDERDEDRNAREPRAEPAVAGSPRRLEPVGRDEPEASGAPAADDLGDRGRGLLAPPLRRRREGAGGLACAVVQEQDLASARPRAGPLHDGRHAGPLGVPHARVQAASTMPRRRSARGGAST